jgi:hypothetical protein
MTPSTSKTLGNSEDIRAALESSPGTQPALSNLTTHDFTTILHGHHLLNY